MLVPPSGLSKAAATKQAIRVTRPSLFIQPRGVLKKELTAHLLTRRHMRLAKAAQATKGPGQALDMASFRERFAEAEDRASRGTEKSTFLPVQTIRTSLLAKRQRCFTMLVKLTQTG
jgi:hypothetical protein